MTRTIAVVLSLVVTLSALPATLTQERRVVSPGSLTRAANYQLQPDVASNGRGFLAIWLDTRADRDSYTYTGSLLWGSHFGIDGTLTSPEGLKLAEKVYSARIASDGNDYLIAIRRGDGIYTQRFDDEGHALADALEVDGVMADPMILVSNGSGYLLTSNNQTAIQWRMLDRLGRPIGEPHVIPASTAATNNALIVTNDGVYHLIYGTQNCSGEGCIYGAADLAVSNGGAATTRTLITLPSYIGYVSAASAGDQFLVAWGGTSGVSEQVFDSRDTAVTPARKLAPAFRQALTVWWDGARYLVSGEDGSSVVLLGQRVGRDGVPIDATPFVVASGAGTRAAFARAGGRGVAVWSASNGSAVPPDIYGHVVFDFNDLAVTLTGQVRLSNAPPVQHSPATAFLAGKALRVWRSGDGNGSIAMAIDGGDTVVLSPENGDSQRDPDVAAIGDVALVVWRSYGLARRVLGIRIDANGKPLDQQPIVIDENTLAAPSSRDRASVATDGHAFLVAWTGAFVVNAKRIASDGSLLDAAPIVASHNDHFVPAGVKALWNGTNYVVVYDFEDNGLTLLPPVIVVELFAVRITSSGVALDTAANRLLYQEAGAIGEVSAAAAGNRLIIAFSETPYSASLHSELHTVEVSVDPLPNPVASHVIAQVAYPFAISDAGIAARGDTFLVTWSQDGANGSAVRAQFLDRGESFVVDDDDAYDVTVAPNANGFSFTYARTDPDADSVAQLFTRDLVLPPEKHRAIR